MRWDYLEQFISKRVKIIFDDGQDIKRKEGILKGFDETFIFLEANEEIEALARDRVVRIEFLEGGE